ncbi:MAG: hypothetical protein ACM3S4_11670 [Burkholderiales bacterium]
MKKRNTILFFFEKTSTDLDGDGKKETIKLLPGETKTIDDEQYYKSIILSVNGKELKVTADKDWNLGFDDISSLYGVILDIEKSDNEKEILIYEQKDVVSDNDKLLEKAAIYTYKDGQPQIALEWLPPVQANGTGYVVYTEYSKVLKGGYSIGLQAVKHYSNTTGFKEIEMERYPTITYTSQSAEKTVETVWDQKVAQTPGGETDTLVAKKSLVYFGLYDPLGWIEVFSSDDDKRLGWLDLNKVDIDAYIGYALQASCH